MKTFDRRKNDSRRLLEVIEMRATSILAVALAFGLVAFANQEARAETATPEETELVCQNWLSYMIHKQGAWAGDTEPKIVEVQDIVVNGDVLGYCYSITPNGYVVVPVLKELPPIKAYSERHHLDLDTKEK